MSFFCPGTPSRTPHDIESSCLLRPLLAVIVFQTVLSFDDLDSFEQDWPGMCRMCLHGDSADVFLLIRLELWAWGGRSQRESAVVIKGMCCQHGSRLLVLTLIAWLRSYLSGFSLLSPPSPALFHTVLCGRESLRPVHS